jgi:hypothetical protein
VAKEAVEASSAIAREAARTRCTTEAGVAEAVLPATLGGPLSSGYGMGEGISKGLTEAAAATVPARPLPTLSRPPSRAPPAGRQSCGVAATVAAA